MRQHRTNSATHFWFVWVQAVCAIPFAPDRPLLVKTEFREGLAPFEASAKVTTLCPSEVAEGGGALWTGVCWLRTSSVCKGRDGQREAQW